MEEPARLEELRGVIRDAAGQAEWEARALALAQDARLQARHDLDAARARLDGARQLLVEKEAAVDAPFTSTDRGLTERWDALIGCWPVRVAERNRPGQEMDAADLAIAGELCSAAAADLHVCPSSIAWDIAQATAWATATKPRGVKVKLPYIGEVTIGKLLAEAEAERRGGTR